MQIRGEFSSLRMCLCGPGPNSPAAYVRPSASISLPFSLGGPGRPRVPPRPLYSKWNRAGRASSWGPQRSGQQAGAGQVECDARCLSSSTAVLHCTSLFSFLPSCFCLFPLFYYFYFPSMGHVLRVHVENPVFLPVRGGGASIPGPRPAFRTCTSTARNASVAWRGGGRGHGTVGQKPM